MSADLAGNVPAQKTPVIVKKRRRRRRIAPGLLRAPQAADYCSLSEASWARLHASGKVPTPIRLGGCVCWSRRELSLWIEYGCLPRREWQEIWHSLRARRERED
jgi:predicted DNA-binding transcriptional regulator AlpA